jgi:23S rRNA (pseudouridine1915-N3)-methyltransferase
MLTLHIITVGRDKEQWISDQLGHYVTLLKRYAAVEFSVVAEAKYSKSTDIRRALAAEASSIESRLKGGYLFLLDTAGKALTTTSLAKEIDTLQTQGYSLLEFVIGGPYGLDPTFKQARQKLGACRLLSLSPLTMSHQIVRLVLLEQLYRVLNLNAGGKYHK